MEKTTHNGQDARPKKIGSLVMRLVLVLLLIAGLGTLGYSAYDYIKTQQDNEAAAQQHQFDPAHQKDYSGISAEDMIPSGKPSKPAEDEKPKKEASSSSQKPSQAAQTPNLSTPDGVGNPGASTGEDDAARERLLSGAGDPQDVPAAVGEAWACTDPSSLQAGQLTWEQARRVSGPAVMVPSLCILSPLTSSNVEAKDDGHKYLQLPPGPWATWYEQTPPAGHGEGNTVIASHVNTRGTHADWSPFSHLKDIDSGAPIVVRDDSGEYHVYKETSTAEYKQTDLPSVEGMYRYDGPETLTLITCTGAPGQATTRGGWVWFDWNLVVTATPVR